MGFNLPLRLVRNLTKTKWKRIYEHFKYGLNFGFSMFIFHIEENNENTPIQSFHIIKEIEGLVDVPLVF